MNETDLMPIEYGNTIVDMLSSGNSDMYMSFQAETPEQRIKVYNAMSGESLTLKSQINKEIMMSDVIVMPVEVKNDTGEQVTVPRVTILDKDGNVFTATSWGVFNCIKRMQAIFGSLHFETGLKIVPREVKTKNGFTLSLQIIG